MSNKLNRASRRKMNRMSTQTFEEATTKTMVRFFAIPCMILAKDYGWAQEELGKYIEQINDLYNEEHDIDYYRRWLWENAGITLAVEG